MKGEESASVIASVKIKTDYLLSMLNFFTLLSSAISCLVTKRTHKNGRVFPFFGLGEGGGGATDDLSVEYIVLKPNIVTQIIN